MNEHEREEQEFEAGRQSDLQIAYSVSMMERKPDDSEAINELLSLGRYVVYGEQPLYCPRTDASMGTAKYLLGDFATHDEAKECYDGQDPEGHEFLTFQAPKTPELNPPTPLRDDEIPF